MKLITLALLSATIVTVGCASTDEIDSVTPVVVQTAPLSRPTLSLPQIDRFIARPVEWLVITPDNVDEMFARLESAGQAVVIFGVSERGYENIALNASESLRVIVQQRAVIDGYERYYIEADGIIYEYNIDID